MLLKNNFQIFVLLFMVFYGFLGLNFSLAKAENSQIKPTLTRTDFLNHEEQIKIFKKPVSRTYKTAPVFAIKTAEKSSNLTTDLNLNATYRQLTKQQKNTKDTNSTIVLNGEQGLTHFSPDWFIPVIDPVQATLQLAQELATTTSRDGQTQSLKLIKHKPVIPTELADLGIQAFLGRGISNFAGSSKNRRINVQTAEKKIRGVIIAPKSTLSFNELLGEISQDQGFVPELVIKKQGLSPEIGGGVCQVSSTLFRAAVASGLNITERKNHSFAVSHYTPIGTDATIYSPNLDLKITNDTNANLLLWSYFPDNDTLYIDFYGTDDGRLVEVKNPIKYGQRSDGGFKTKWDRVVTFTGQLPKTESFVSNYLPASLFHKTEEFVSNTNQ